MSFQVVLGDRELLLNISGWTAVLTLRKEIKIPYTSKEQKDIQFIEDTLKCNKHHFNLLIVKISDFFTCHLHFFKSYFLKKKGIDGSILS
ncbi:hypothetical protein [Pseudogracilibacillus sp. SO30301A]|uniref:hypothetical protein n=1 Tax=Pseudogracilibacillus sp. SO30301A TaxID=3098291 RepID=UPI00300E46C6